MTAADLAGPTADEAVPCVARRLAVAWQNPTTRAISPVAVLDFDGQQYALAYVRRALSVDGFRPLLGFPDLHRRYESEHLFPLFAQRVMDPRRPDHERYVRRLGLGADASPWEQMTRSGGGRHGDLLQMFPEPETLPDGSMTCTFLLHGIRHVPSRPLVLAGRELSPAADEVERRLAALRPGDPLRLVREEGNVWNPRAVITAAADGYPLGWVPDLLLDDLYAMSGGAPGDVDATVEQANGPDAPAHMRVLARLNARPVAGYAPFSGPEWEPLA
jgi:hypothetical protein